MSVWLVQTLEVAFSRRMSCSRARSVVTNERRSLESTVSPTMRPGSRRTCSSVQAKRPRIRTAEGERRAEGLTLAHEDVGAPLPGRLEDPGRNRVGADHEERAVRASPVTSRAAMSSRTPR